MESQLESQMASEDSQNQSIEISQDAKPGSRREEIEFEEYDDNTLKGIHRAVKLFGALLDHKKLTLQTKNDNQKKLEQLFNNISNINLKDDVKRLKKESSKKLDQLKGSMSEEKRVTDALLDEDLDESDTLTGEIYNTISELVFKTQDLLDEDPYSKLHRCMNFSSRLELESCFTLDPIARCDVRKANCQIMKQEFPKQFKSLSFFQETLIKHNPSNLLFMLETGLLWEKDALVDKYLEDLLVGEASIKEYLEDIILGHSFDSSEDNYCQDSNQQQEDAKANIPNLVKMLEVIVHLLLLKNDRAIEQRFFKKKKNYLLVFEDPITCQQVTRGLVDIMTQENIDLYLKDKRIINLMNIVLKMMLSIESDPTTSNLNKVNPDIKILKIKNFSEELPLYVKEVKKAIQVIIENLVLKKYVGNAKYISQLPGELSRDICNIREAIRDSISGDRTAIRYAAIHDLPRSILWLVMALVAYYPFEQISSLTHDLCQILVDWIKFEKFSINSVADIFFSRRNWHLYEVLVAINPSHFLFVMTESCRGYILNDSEFLPMILPPLIEYLVRALNFIDSKKKAQATFEDIIQWIHCIQALIDIYSMLSEGKNEETSNKCRAKMELILKNMIGPKVNFIFKEFAEKQIEIGLILKAMNNWPSEELIKSYSPLLISSDYSAVLENMEKFSYHWGSSRYLQERFTCSLTNFTSPNIPGVFMLEFYCYILRLFNVVIKNSELKGMQFVLFEDSKEDSLEAIVNKLDYLRNLRNGYMFLTEFHSVYSNLIMADLPEHSLFEYNLLPQNQTPSKNTDLQSMNTFKELEAEIKEGKQSNFLTSVAWVGIEKKKRVEALKHLTLSLGIDEVCDYDLFPEVLLKPIDKQKSVKKVKLVQYFKERSEQVERLIQKTNQFQGDMLNPSMKQLYKMYMQKGLIRIIYKFICSLMYVAPIHQYDKAGVLKVIECFINNLATISRFFPEEINIEGSYISSLIDSVKNKQQGLDVPNSNPFSASGNDLSGSVQQIYLIIIDKFKSAIENLYKEQMPECHSELLKVSRDSFKDLTENRPSKLYRSIGLKENASLYAIHQRITEASGESNNGSSEEEAIHRIEEKIFEIKRLNMTEKGEFIKALVAGSEYSKDAYFENVSKWISIQLEEITQKSELYPGCNLILYSDVYSLLHIMDNLMIFNQSVRAKIHYQHEKVMTANSNVQELVPLKKSIISYLIEALIHSQKLINSSVFSNTILLDLERCFTYCELLKNLTQNNSTRVKILIGHWVVDSSPNRTAMEEILNHLAIDCDERQNKITVQDRADLAWYNIVCLSLLTECLSGPCSENQDLLETKLKGNYLDLFHYCSRMIISINNPFCSLQACVAKFLLAVFEGPNMTTMKRLNDFKPVNLYNLITNHLLNMWNFYKDPRIVRESKLTEKKKVTKNLKRSKNMIVLASQKMARSPNDPDKDKLLRLQKDEEEEEEENEETTVKKGNVKPNLDSLVALYKADKGFATNSSIVLARTVYLIMTYAESSGLRRFSIFLDKKRAEQKIIQEGGFEKLNEIKDIGDEEQEQGERLASAKASLRSKMFKASSLRTNTDRAEAEILLLLFVFLNKITGTIEITTKDHKSDTEKQVRVVFPILPDCLFFSQSKVRRFLERCNVNNHNERLLELINFSDETMVSIHANKSLYEFSSLLSNIMTYDAMNVVLYIAWAISVVMNIIWLSFADVKMQPAYLVSIYERDDTIDMPSQLASTALLILSCVLCILCGSYLIAWLLIRYKIAIGDKKLQIMRTHHREGPFKRQYRILKLYLWDSLLVQGQPMIFALHILFVLLYYFSSTICITFHLLLFVHHFETTRFIIRSVTTHFSKILTALLYILFLVYCCSTIIGYHYADKFNEDFRTKGLNNLWVSSFAYVLDYGLQGGGGIGDYMQVFYPSEKYFIEKAVVVIAFFIIVRVIFQNIMLGIIVDTFKELRGNQTKRCRLYLL